MTAVAKELRRRATEIAITTDRPNVVDQAERALVEAGGVYVRARALVHVVRDRGEGRGVTYPDGQPVIARVLREHLLERFARAARWVAPTPDGVRAAAVPTWAASMLLARDEWPSLPQLEGVADCPVLRADGTIHDVPGYDERTRVIYDPGETVYPAIPAAPTRDDAARALNELFKPFCDFALVAPSDRSAVAALILSIVARSAIDGCVPMFVVGAPTPGSGKGLLVDAVATIATGRASPKMAPTADDDEMRKRLLAYAIEAPAIITIDNVEGSLGGASLAMALTAGIVTDRVLGVSETRTVPLRAVFAATGNNVQLKGDLGRRVVPIDIDPRVEHPEDRQGWRHADLLGHVRDQRPRLVVAALTLLRAYHLAGRPTHANPAKGSFEPWDRLVRGSIVWAGSADPLGGVQRIREQGDEDLDRLRALLAAWHVAFGNRGVTVAEAVKHAGESGDLHDALAAYSTDPKRLGYALRKMRGRIVGGGAMELDGKTRDGARRWVVQTMRTMQTMVSPDTDRNQERVGLEVSPASPASPASPGVETAEDPRGANEDADLEDLFGFTCFPNTSEQD